MEKMTAETLILHSGFDIAKMINIMNSIDHKWCLQTGEFRVPNYQEIKETIQHLIDMIMETEDFQLGKVDTPIHAACGGISIVLKMIYSDAFKNNRLDEHGHLDGPALNYRWEISYVPMVSTTWEH